MSWDQQMFGEVNEEGIERPLGADKLPQAKGKRKAATKFTNWTHSEKRKCGKQVYIQKARPVLESHRMGFYRAQERH